MKRVILIHGLPSSGTSAVAQACHRWGMDIGSDVLRETPHRPYRTYECATLCSIFSKPWARRTDQEWERLVAEVQFYLSSRLKCCRAPMVKFPAFARLTHGFAWDDDMPITPVLVYRRREDVERSYLSYGKQSTRVRKQRLDRLRTLSAEIERFNTVYPPALVVFYNEVIENPLEVADRIGSLRLSPADRGCG